MHAQQNKLCMYCCCVYLLFLLCSFWVAHSRKTCAAVAVAFAVEISLRSAQSTSRGKFAGAPRSSIANICKPKSVRIECLPRIDCVPLCEKIETKRDDSFFFFFGSISSFYSLLGHIAITNIDIVSYSLKTVWLPWQFYWMWTCKMITVYFRWHPDFPRRKLYSNIARC